MRVLVCGGRDYADEEKVFATLDRLHARTPISLVIQGEASGADRLAKRWAASRDVACVGEPADWDNLDAPGAVIRRNRLGKPYNVMAGFDRNQAMLDKWHPNLCVAFPGGRGTADMVRRAYKAKVNVWEIEQ